MGGTKLTDGVNFLWGAEAVWAIVRGIGLAVMGWLMWQGGWTPLQMGILAGGIILLGILIALEWWTATCYPPFDSPLTKGRFRGDASPLTGGTQGRSLVSFVGLVYDLALVSLLMSLLSEAGHGDLPLPLLYLLPCAYTAWQLGNMGGVLSAVLTPVAFWLTHWATTRSPLPDSPADWGWLGGLAGCGLLMAGLVARPTMAERFSEDALASMQERMMQILEETEATHRELRASYRELAHHYQRLQDSLTTAQDALEVLSAIHQVGSPQQVYPAMLDRLRERFCAAGAALWLIDEQKLQIQVIHASGVLTQLRSTLRGSGARPAWQQKVAYETVQYLKSLPADSGEALAEVHRLGAKAEPRVLTVPLRTSTRYYGILVLVADSPEGFAPGVEERLQALAPHLTAMVSLYEQLSLMEARLQETQVLNDLDKLLFTVATPAEIPKRALALLQPVLGFECAMLALRPSLAPHPHPLSKEGAESPSTMPRADGEDTGEAVEKGEFYVAARWRDMPDILPSLQFEKGRGVQGWRAMRARPLLISDTREDPHAEPTLAQAGIGSLMLVGLSTGMRLNGFLLMAHSQPGFFTPAELETAQMIATHLALLMERARLLRQLEQLAVTDGLTGLYNYRHFHERYQEEVRRARRYQTPFAVMLVDMDNFKQVNDQYGHLEGDYVLMQVAELIRRAVRETEFIARYGGDEFAILLPATNLHGALSAGQRLLQAVRTSQFSTTEGDPIPDLTLSIGLAAYPDSSDSPAEILEKADEALETAKKTGRNRLEAVVNLE